MGEMVAGWGRVRERGGPAQGPGWQMTPGCRPNVPVGFLEIKEEWTRSRNVGKCFQLRGAKIHFEATVKPNWLSPDELGDRPSG